MSVAIIGAGVAGLTSACELIDRGIKPIVYEQSDQIGEQACSWLAGGMLAPWCESESVGHSVVEMGKIAMQWWTSHIDGMFENGSLVLSPRRDLQEIKRFSRLTENHQVLNKQQINELEPDLQDRFEQGLWFNKEAHLDPRNALLELADYAVSRGATINFSSEVQADDLDARIIIDCRGFKAQNSLSDLRGVKGEMLLLQTDEIQLSRPVRLLHPRYPVYIVPRKKGLFMLGATVIENAQRERITALSMLELLSAAYALHPSFGEAQIAEIGVDVRPAYSNNLPSLKRKNNVLYINGLYRHGFLLGPAMAIRAADIVTNEQQFVQMEQCA